jgi:hypothetical protein
MSRNHIGFLWLDLDDPGCVAHHIVADNMVSPEHAAATITERELGASALPLVILENGRRLEAPSFRELAEALELQTVPTRGYRFVSPEAVQQDLPPRFMERRKGSPRWPSSALPAADRPARRRASRTTSASRPDCPAMS